MANLYFLPGEPRRALTEYALGNAYRVVTGKDPVRDIDGFDQWIKELVGFGRIEKIESEDSVSIDELAVANKVAAVKLYRERSGCSLAEARDHVMRLIACRNILPEYQNRPLGMISIWVDDLRPAPDGYQVWCRSVHGTIDIIKQFEDAHIMIDVIDLDHDAGDFYPKGGDYYKILDWLEETGRSYPIRIHSQNPVGVQKMRVIIEHNHWAEVR